MKNVNQPFAITSEENKNISTLLYKLLNNEIKSLVQLHESSCPCVSYHGRQKNLPFLACHHGLSAKTQLAAMNMFVGHWDQQDPYLKDYLS